MQIRYLQATDFAEVCQIEQENFIPEEQIAVEILADYCQTATISLAIADEDQLAAYLLVKSLPTATFTDKIYTEIGSLTEAGRYLGVASLSVATRYQGQGLGTLLLASLKEVAVEQGLEGIVLTCHEELVAYYEKNGFEEVGLSASTFAGQEWSEMLWIAPN